MTGERTCPQPSGLTPVGKVQAPGALHAEGAGRVEAAGFHLEFLELFAELVHHAKKDRDGGMLGVR